MCVARQDITEGKVGLLCSRSAALIIDMSGCDPRLRHHNRYSQSDDDDEELLDVFKQAEMKQVIKTYSSEEVARLVFHPKTVERDDEDDELARRQRECRRHLQNLRTEIEEWESAEARKAAQKEEMERWLDSLQLRSHSLVYEGPNNYVIDGGSSSGSIDSVRSRRSPRRAATHHRLADRIGTPSSSSLPAIRLNDPSIDKDGLVSSHSSPRQPSSTRTGGAVRPKGTISFAPSIDTTRSSGSKSTPKQSKRTGRSSRP